MSGRAPSATGAVSWRRGRQFGHRHPDRRHSTAPRIAGAITTDGHAFYVSVATASSVGLARSDDDGASFKAKAKSPGYITAIQALANGHLHINGFMGRSMARSAQAIRDNPGRASLPLSGYPSSMKAGASTRRRLRWCSLVLHRRGRHLVAAISKPICG
jgi:hypothetical protein